MIKRALMHGVRTCRVAFRALARNKMRSFLTALGIIIGVGAVIAMVSIGEGAKRGIESRFAAMGTNLLFVSPGSQAARGVHGGWGSMQTLKEEDAAAIGQECPAVMYISPSVSARAQTVYGNKNWNTSISGTGDRYPEVRNWDVEFGSYFDENQVKSAAKVCVLGADVKTNLFEDEDPVGKVIRVKKIPFKVLGVLKKRGESGGFGSRDDMIAIPYTTAMRRLQGIDYIQSVDVRAVSADQMPQAQAQIEELLRVRHKIATLSIDKYFKTRTTFKADAEWGYKYFLHPFLPEPVEPLPETTTMTAGIMDMGWGGGRQYQGGNGFIPRTSSEGGGAGIGHVSLSLLAAQGIDDVVGLSASAVRQWTVTGENPFLSIEEFYLVQNPSADSFSWEGRQFNGRITMNLPWSVELKAGYTYSDKTYPGVESMSLEGVPLGIGRNDLRHLFEARLEKSFRRVSLFLAYSWVDNRSSDPLFVWKSHFIMGGFEWNLPTGRKGGIS